MNKNKKYLISLMVALFITANAMAATDNNGDGSIDINMELTLTSNMNTLQSSSSLSGCTVLVTGDPGNGYMDTAETRLNALGATVTKANPSTLTGSMLSQYDVVWIALAGADDVDNAGKATIINEYVHNGGGLILEQPNTAITPNCLPYTFQITSKWYADHPQCCASTILQTHYLTQGLTTNEMPPGYDTVGTIAPDWTVLVQDGTGGPTLSVATYGSGRVIVELGNTGTGYCVCGICQHDVMIERMVKWAGQECTPSVPEFLTPAIAVVIISITPMFAYLIARKRQ